MSRKQVDRIDVEKLPIDTSKLTWEQYEALRKEKQRAMLRKYAQSAAGQKAARVKYRNFKKKLKTDPEFQERMREYYRNYRKGEVYKDPARMAKRRERAKFRYYFLGGKEQHLEYLRRPEVKEKEKERRQSDDFKAHRRERQTTEEYKAWQRAYKKKKYQEKKAQQALCKKRA